MFNDVSNMINNMKEKAMEAMLPMDTPKETKEKLLALSHKMSPKQIAEFGEKIIQARKEAKEEYWRRKEQEAQT